MKNFKPTFLALLCFLFFTHIANAQEPSASLEFDNAETALQLVKNYTDALQKGDVNSMSAQLSDNALIYGLGGRIDSLNTTQHKDYFTNSTNLYKHSITRDLYLPVKVKDNWNEGEWILAWGTNTLTDKISNKKIELPYHIVSKIENGKIVYMRYFYDMLHILNVQGYTITPPKM